MLVAILAMWVSTVIYWISTLVYAAKTNNGLHTIIDQNAGAMTNIELCAGAMADSSLALIACQDASQYIGQDPYNLPPYSETDAARRTRGCIGSAALMANVGTALLDQFKRSPYDEATWPRQIAIGDTIVWWRAWVLWPKNRWVQLVCVVMITLTTGTQHSSSHSVLCVLI